MDGAQTLSRFCLFAVLYFIIIFVFFLFFFPCCEKLRCRMKMKIEKMILKNTAEELLEWNGDLYD